MVYVSLVVCMVHLPEYRRCSQISSLSQLWRAASESSLPRTEIPVLLRTYGELPCTDCCMRCAGAHASLMLYRWHSTVQGEVHFPREQPAPIPLRMDRHKHMVRTLDVIFLVSTPILPCVTAAASMWHLNWSARLKKLKPLSHANTNSSNNVETHDFGFFKMIIVSIILEFYL